MTQVFSSQLMDNSVLEAKIGAGAVSVTKIAANAVTTVKIADGNVTEAKLAANAVSSVKILDGAVGATKLADNSVQESKIVDGAVSNAKLAADAVSTVKILNGNVTTIKLADGSVTTIKLADGSVTGVKLAGNSVTADKIVDGTVGTNELADGGVTGVKIGAAAISLTHMGADSVGGSQVISGAITEAHLSAAAQAKLNNTPSRITKDFAPTADADASNTHASVAAGDWEIGDKATVGSMWFYTDTSDADVANHVYEIYRCVKADAGAAVWVKTSIDSSELKDLAFTNLTTLQTTIVLDQSRITGLTDALNAKADKTDVVSKSQGGSFNGSVTFTQAIIGNLTGDVTGNVTGQVSDVSNHLSTLANGTAGQFVGADELKTKFAEMQTAIDSKQSALQGDVDDFEGDGATTSFTYGVAGETNVLSTVFRNGIRQKKDEDYTDNGVAISIASAPLNGEKISVERVYLPL